MFLQKIKKNIYKKIHWLNYSRIACVLHCIISGKQGGTKTNYRMNCDYIFISSFSFSPVEQCYTYFSTEPSYFKKLISAYNINPVHLTYAIFFKSNNNINNTLEIILKWKSCYTPPSRVAVSKTVYSQCESHHYVWNHMSKRPPIKWNTIMGLEENLVGCHTVPLEP